jgi:hypothetical protein
MVKYDIIAWAIYITPILSTPTLCTRWGIIRKGKTAFAT